MSEQEEENLVGSTIRYEGKSAEVIGTPSNETYLLEFKGGYTEEVSQTLVEETLNLKDGDDVPTHKLRQVIKKASNEDRLFSEYGEAVAILQSDEEVMREILISCEAGKLLNIIDVVEDRLSTISHVANSDKSDMKRLLYVRYMAIREFRKRVGVPEEYHWSQYKPTDDYVIDSYVENGGELDI